MSAATKPGITDAQRADLLAALALQVCAEHKVMAEGLRSISELITVEGLPTCAAIMARGALAKAGVAS